jgi:hypothetical protein
MQTVYEMDLFISKSEIIKKFKIRNGRTLIQVGLKRTFLFSRIFIIAFRENVLMKSDENDTKNCQLSRKSNMQNRERGRGRDDSLPQVTKLLFFREPFLYQAMLVFHGNLWNPAHFNILSCSQHISPAF